MSYEKLTRTVELAVEFKNAVEAGLGNDSSLRGKLLAAMKPGEMEQLTGKLQDIAEGAMELAFGGGKPSEEFLKKNVEITDTMAELFNRVVPEAKMASFIPAELKSDDNVQYLRDLGATNLAKLSAFKPK